MDLSSLTSLGSIAHRSLPTDQTKEKSAASMAFRDLLTLHASMPMRFAISAVVNEVLPSSPLISAKASMALIIIGLTGFMLCPQKFYARVSHSLFGQSLPERLTELFLLV